jgi:hypothetical protein
MVHPMTKLRRALLPLLAAICLAGLPACGQTDAERAADKAVNKAKTKAKRSGEKIKKAADGY